MTVLKYWDQTSGTYKTLTGPPGPPGPGVPAGGATSTVLGKNSATDFDTVWSGPMLPLAGGTLTNDLRVTRSYAPTTGAIYFGNGSIFLYMDGSAFNFSGVRLTGVGDPTTGADGVNKTYADRMLPLTGGTLSGPLSVTLGSGSTPLTVKAAAGVGTYLAIDKAAGFDSNLIGSVAGKNRWQVTLGNSATETGSNVGSDFAIWRCTDAGGYIDAPLTITRASGATTLTGGLTISTPAGIDANFVLNKATGRGAQVIGENAGSIRWVAIFGDGATESGSNAGSNFQLSRFSDAGALIDTPLAITRSTGTVAINTTGATTALTVKGSGATSLTIDKAANSVAQIINTNAGVLRWVVVLSNAAAESGGNAGSDFQINNYSDAGANIGTPLIITRSNGNALFSGSVTVNGSALAMNNSGGVTLQLISPNATVHQIASYTGASAVAGTTRWVFQMGDGTSETGSNAGCNAMFYAYGDSGAGLGPAWSAVRSTQVVTFAKAIVNGASDRSLKENITPLEGSLDKVIRLQGVSFNMIDDADKRRHIGLIAQDVAPVVPEIIQEYRSGDEEPKLALDYPKLTALLIEAVKTLAARVQTLEAKV